MVERKFSRLSKASEQKEMVSQLVKYVDNEVADIFVDILKRSRKKKMFNNCILDYLDTRHYWEKNIR